MVNQEEFKPYLAELNGFIVKFFQLRKNKYTQNDYLYHRNYKDFNIGYNPRCQLLDITPRSRLFSDSFWLHECQKMQVIAQKAYDDLSYAFFLKTGKVLDRYIHCRLYGVQCQNHSFPYITQLSKGNVGEWSEVENWQEHCKIYQKDKLFKYAYWGPACGYKKHKEPNKEENKIIEKKPKPTKYLSIDRYKEYYGNF